MTLALAMLLGWLFGILFIYISGWFGFPFSNHGYRVFITHAQYSIFIGSLVVVAVLFLLGVIIYEMNKKQSR